jgi:hypothetical protein
LFGSFFLSGMASIDENLETLESIPLFITTRAAIALNDMNWGWLGILTGMAGLMIFLAWLLFERRDIRVGGEGWMASSGTLPESAYLPRVNGSRFIMGMDSARC